MNEMMQVVDQIEEDVVEAMAYAGEEFVTEAREMNKSEGGFGDVTGNLRSSIGYFILKDGEVIDQGYTGNAEGKHAANKVLGLVKRNRGIQLVGVAGMEYATYVESKGFNVISRQGDAMLVDLEKYIKDIQYKFNK